MTGNISGTGGTVTITDSLFRKSAKVKFIGTVTKTSVIQNQDHKSFETGKSVASDGDGSYGTRASDKEISLGL